MRSLLGAVAFAWLVSPAAAQTAPLSVVTQTCPAGVQGAAYAGCTITATGGSPPYNFFVNAASYYSPLPEGLSISAQGVVSGAEIGGQGVYLPRIVVTDSAGGRAGRFIAFDIYQLAFSLQQPGLASAMSVMFMLIVKLVSLVQMRLLRARWSY